MAAPHVEFDTTVNLGHLLTILAAAFSSAVSALVAFFRLKGKLDVIEKGNEVQLQLFAQMQAEIAKMREAMVMQARFDERLMALQREVTELRHGKGFVKNSIPAGN
jgi:hypothetical protein